MRKRNITELSLKILIFVSIIILWEGIVRGLNISQTVFPTVSDVWGILLSSLFDGILLKHFWVTLIESLSGFIIGSFSGIILAVLVVEISWVKKLIYPYIFAIQNIPIVALAPLFLIWFGFGTSSKIALVVAIVFFPVLVNTVNGLENADKSQVKLLRAYAAPPWQIFRRIKIPNSLPYVFAGIEIAIVLSVVAAVISEFVGSNAGLGYLIVMYNNQLNMAAQFAVLIVLGILGITLSFAVQKLTRKFVFWQDEFDKKIGL
jgi:NitT/TauT family transport system permease protein